MKYEYVNGAVIPIKKIYEYINGSQQEISKKYEYVDGATLLVYQNKVIKEKQIVNSNGYGSPTISGGMTGGSRTSLNYNQSGNYVYGGYGYVYDDEAQTVEFSGLTLGEANNKKIIEIRGELYAIFWDGRSWGSYPETSIYDNNNNRLYRKTWEYSNSQSGDNVKVWAINSNWGLNFTITPNRTINSLKITTTNLHKYGASSYTGRLSLGFRNLYVKYEDYV